MGCCCGECCECGLFSGYGIGCGLFDSARKMVIPLLKNKTHFGAKRASRGLILLL